MNDKSHLVKFIFENPDSFDERLRDEYHITVKRDGDLAIFNYTYGCDFSDDIVQESRGIIIDTKKLEVVCWPFRKFGNHNEPYADEIDWNSARVLEKVDGSIIKLWFDNSADGWEFSTNGNIRAKNANVDGTHDLNFMKVIRSSKNFGEIPFDELDKTKTYIFELVSPETKVIISYPETLLYHIGTRSNITGEEFDDDIGIVKPKSYKLSSLGDCIDAARALNDGGDDIENEGFVVVDKYYRRVKIKSPDYIVNHKLKLSLDISKRECVEILLTKREELDTIYKLQPALEPVFKFYDYHIARLKVEADKLARLAHSLLLEYNGERGVMARIISKHSLAPVAFRAIDGKTGGAEALINMPIERFLKLIPDYESSDFSELFKKD